MSSGRAGRSWRQSVLLCLLGLAAIAAGFLAVSQVGTPASSARTETEVVTAEDGVVQTSVSGTGNIEAGTDDDVNFTTSGTLKHVYVHQDERVTKGQILATLDPTSAQLTLNQATATLTAAEDTLTDAEDSSSSSSTTTTTGTTSTESAASVGADEVAVESDEETVKNDKQALAETTLRAPVTGTIVSLEELYPGDTVEAGASSTSSSSDTSTTSSSDTTTAGSLGGSSSSSSSSSTSSTGFAEIVNTRTLTMTVPISEADIGEIKVGQPATVTMDALTGVELAAHVAAISQTATDSSDVVSYDVTLDLDQTDSRVLSGMSASAVMIIDQASGVTVPNDAVSGSGSDGIVTLEQNGKELERQVVVGLRGSTRSVIVSGLKAGDELVVSQTLPSLGSSTTTTSSGSSGTLGGSSGVSGAPGAGGPP